MHIVNITYNKTLGGVEQTFLQYCKHLHASEHRVTAITPEEAAIARYVEDAGIPLTKNNLIEKKRNFNPLTTRKLRASLKQLNPDLIVVHNARPIKLIKAALDKKRLIVAVHHGGKIDRLMEADHIICICKYMIQDLLSKNFPPENIHYIPNATGVISDYVPTAFPDQNELLTIGALGRLSYEKGFDILLRALERVKRPYKAILAGDGPLGDELKKQAANLPVSFPGWINEKDKPSFFKECDLIVVPSRAESFGLTVLESWANHKPVIASMSKGPEEIISHERDGLLFPIDRPDILGNLINSVSKTRLTLLSKNGYTTLSENYTVKEQNRRLITLLNKLLGADKNINPLDQL